MEKEEAGRGTNVKVGLSRRNYFADKCGLLSLI